MSVIIQNSAAGISFLMDESEIYFIDKDRISEKRVNHVSEWVAQLSEKSWLNLEDLYLVAKIIQDDVPDNNIDWMGTFFPVEKGDYLEKFKYLMKVARNDTKSDFIQLVNAGISENTDEINDEIKKIITQKLALYNIN